MFQLLRLYRWTLIAASNLLPWPLFVNLRARLYRLAGSKVGRGARIFGQQLIGDPQNLRVGEGVFINARCIFDAFGMISIDDGTLLGPGVQIYTTHHTEDFSPIAKPVAIGGRCWIGGGASFMPGCTLDAGSTVAAGSVLVGRHYTAGVYAGVPAKFLRPPDR